MGKIELIALLNLSSWCLVMVERLFLVVPRGCLQFVIVVFPDHTHLLLLKLGCVRCSDAVDDNVSGWVLLDEACLVRGPEWLLQVLGEDVAWGRPKLVSDTAETSLLRGSKGLENSNRSVSNRADGKFGIAHLIYSQDTLVSAK